MSLEKVRLAEADKARMVFIKNTVNQNVIDPRKKAGREKCRSASGRQTSPMVTILYHRQGDSIRFGHPYNSHRSWIAGRPQTVPTLEDTKEFFANWYTPQNITVHHTGDFEPAEAASGSFETYFGGIRLATYTERLSRCRPGLDEELHSRDSFAKVPQLTMSGRRRGISRKNFYALEVLNDYLSDGRPRGPFNEVMIDEEHAEQAVGTFTYFKGIGG